MAHKLFISDGKPIRFNLIGFESNQYFIYARKIEKCGGRVSLPDEFSPEAITIVNTDACYTSKFIEDSIDNNSLAESQNYCLKNIIENILENNIKQNNLDDDLSTTTMESEKNHSGDSKNEINYQSNGLYSQDDCLEESPDLLKVENDVTTDETDVEETQMPDDEVAEQSVFSNSSDDDDVVLNSDNDTMAKYENLKSQKRIRNNTTDSLDDESSDDIQKTRRKKKITRLSSPSSKSNADSTNDEEADSEILENSEKNSEESNAKQMVLMNKIVVACSPPTSQDEADTHTDEIRPKKRSIRKKNLLNKTLAEKNQPEEITTEKSAKTSNDHTDDNFINKDNQQQKAAPVNTNELNIQTEHHIADQSNIETVESISSDDISDNSLLSLDAVQSTTKWLKNQVEIEARMKKIIRNPAHRYYEPWEEMGILWWLLKSNNIRHVGCAQTWKDLIKDGYLSHRTWRGLYNHFHRRMLKKLSTFKLPPHVHNILLKSYCKT